MISEDRVKKAMAAWLESKDYECIKCRLATAKGIDVEGINPTSQKRIAIECKGESNAKNQWDNAWRNVAHALFNLIKDSEDQNNKDEVAMALPDTEDYRKRMEGLRAFCKRQGIAVFWVASNDTVSTW